MAKTEFLINIKNVPTKDSAEHDAFWDNERNKAEYGFTADGVYIPAWLYWHTNLWGLYKDEIDIRNGVIKRAYSKPDFRDNEWIIAEHLEKATKEKKGLLIFGSRRQGKQLADYEPLITPNGEKRIGDAQVGDVVYGRDGKKTIITGVFPQGVDDIYRLHFIDGRYVDAGLDHQWVFKSGGKERIYTTKQLLTKKLKTPCKKGGYTYSYYLPVCKPVEFDKKELPISPYILGLLLGDGNTISKTPYISTSDDEIETYIKKELEEDYEITYDKTEYKALGFPCKRIIKYVGKERQFLYDQRYRINPLNKKIESLNLNVDCYNKFIPNLYKYSSVEQRFELLRGLMDSDGSINTEGSCEFSVVNKQLAEDVLWLARSLGIRSQMSFEDLGVITKTFPKERNVTFHSKKYRVFLRTDLPIFKLTRKLKRLRVRKNTSNVALSHIEYIGKHSATCISVDNDEHLYLTKDFIVTHNTEFLSSYIARSATLYEGSQNIVGGGNWGDIDVIMFNISKGLNGLPEYFRFGRLAENLRKEIELGFKDKKGTRYSWSKIIARNHEEGNDTEVFAGLTATSFVLDEVGKAPFSSVFNAAMPAFTSPFGWRTIPILTGTSGDMTKAKDAKAFFENPEAYNFLPCEIKEEGGKKVGLFISGLNRMEGKEKTTLGDYIESEKLISLPKESELFTIPFYKSNYEKAEQIIDEYRIAASKSPDPTALLKETMYYPKNTKELFLTDDGNNFPIEALKEHLSYLEANEQLQGMACRLYRDIDNKVKISYNTNKKPIIEFPLKDFNGIKKDAPIVIYEPPIDGAYTYLNISGADPYNQSSSKWSSSLGSIFIFKRLYDPISGSFQRRIVAEYTARPDTMREFHETCELLLELYNAVCLPENEAQTFIQYFDIKNKGYMLADGYSFLKEIHPSTTITGRNKGLPATTKVQSYYKELVFQYLTEELVIGTKEDGEPIKKLGLVRIPSIGLIKELIAYNDKGNFDRYVAFGHVLAHEVWADKIYPFIKQIEAPKQEINNNRIEIKSPFKLGNTSMYPKSTNPFGIKR